MKRGFRLLAGILIFFAVCGGCAPRGGWSRHEICFGLSAESGGKNFSDEEWRAFVDGEIASRFPDGFTVHEARGYWRASAGTFSEPSRILMVVTPDNEDTQTKLTAIATAYARRFQQEAVLQITSPASLVVFHGE